MSTSHLYQAYQITGVQYKSTEYSKNEIIYKTKLKIEDIQCPRCKAKHFHKKDSKTRRFRLIPIGRKKCFLDVLLFRFECQDCNKKWWPKLPFMCGIKRIAKCLMNYVVDMLQIGTIKDVANHIGSSWGVVKIIHKQMLKKFYRKIDISEIVYLGIDEFSIKKGHEYMTIFIDLQSGRIVHAVRGRDVKSIRSFLKKLRKKATKLKAVAMDMSRPYIAGVKEHLPHVDIVFDRFHVQAMMNRTIDELRRDEQNELPAKEKSLLKGARFIFLRNYEALSSVHNERLLELLNANMSICIAYVLKENFRRFWEKKTLKEGAAFLLSWVMDATDSGIPHLKKIADTLMKYHEELLNYFKHRITNGKTEGINNKIKTLKRQMYGFRDEAYFKLRLYHLHEQNYKLV
jgi:transposase